MAVATTAQVGKRVIWLIGARLSNGTYSLDTSDDDRFNDDEVKDAIVETESELVRDLCESRHPMRQSFISTSSAVTHGDKVPAHIGPLEVVTITKSSGGDAVNGQKITRTDIELWRENESSRFDDLNHTADGSKLSGYYAMDGDTLFFTGFSATVDYCSYDPDFTTWVLQIDEQFTDALVAGTVTKLYKVGVPRDVLNTQSQIYAQERSMIKGAKAQAVSLEEEQVRD